MAGKKKASNVPDNETPQARFVRMANVKVNALLRGLKGLSRLKDKKAVSTSAQREAIQSVLEVAVADCIESLNGAKSDSSGFKL